MALNQACREAHRFILRGKCPWCDYSIAGESSPSHSEGTVQWDMPAVITLLDESNRTSFSFFLISYMMSHERIGARMLPLFNNALQQTDRNIRWLSASILTQRGRELLQEDAERLEEELHHGTDDPARHLLLLGYYYPRSLLVASFRVARLQHVRWIVERTPHIAFFGRSQTCLDPATDGDAYYVVERCWLQHIATNPQDALLLGNAAAFFANSNPQRSIAFLKRALTLEPTNVGWLQELLALYISEVKHRSDGMRCEAISLALAEIATIVRHLDKASDRLWVLSNIANLAVELDELGMAHAYATEVLTIASRANPFFPETGMALHHGNLALGRIALRNDDIDAATRHLLKAVDCQHSPFLEVVGPGLILAKELLDRGERVAVIRYLKLCSNFWQTPDQCLDQWISVLEHGGYPDFGPEVR